MSEALVAGCVVLLALAALRNQGRLANKGALLCDRCCLKPRDTSDSDGKGTKFTQLACQLPLSEAYRGLTRQARLLSSFYLVSSPSRVYTQ